MRYRRPLALLLLLALCQCRPADAAADDDAAIYTRALAVLYRDAGIRSQLLVHPHPALLDLNPADSTVSVRFSTYADKLILTRAVKDNPNYHICTLAGTHSCAAPPDSPYVVLSEIRELPNDEIGIGAMIARHSDAMPINEYYGIKLRRGFWGWRVVSVVRVA